MIWSHIDDDEEELLRLVIECLQNLDLLFALHTREVYQYSRRRPAAGASEAVVGSPRSQMWNISDVASRRN